MTFVYLDMREHAVLKRTSRRLNEIGHLVTSSLEYIAFHVSDPSLIDGDISKRLGWFRPRRLRLEAGAAFPDAYGSALAKLAGTFYLECLCIHTAVPQTRVFDADGNVRGINASPHPGTLPLQAFPMLTSLVHTNANVLATAPALVFSDFFGAQRLTHLDVHTLMLSDCLHVPITLCTLRIHRIVPGKSVSAASFRAVDETTRRTRDWREYHETAWLERLSLLTALENLELNGGTVLQTL